MNVQRRPATRRPCETCSYDSRMNPSLASRPRLADAARKPDPRCRSPEAAKPPARVASLCQTPLSLVSPLAIKHNDRTPREAPKSLPLRGLVRPHLLLCVNTLIACLIAVLA